MPMKSPVHPGDLAAARKNESKIKVCRQHVPEELHVE